MVFLWLFRCLVLWMVLQLMFTERRPLTYRSMTQRLSKTLRLHNTEQTESLPCVIMKHTSYISIEFILRFIHRFVSHQIVCVWSLKIHYQVYVLWETSPLYSRYSCRSHLTFNGQFMMPHPFSFSFCFGDAVPCYYLLMCIYGYHLVQNVFFHCN